MRGVTRRSIHRFLVASVPGALALRGGWASWLRRPPSSESSPGVAHAAQAAPEGGHEYIVVGSGAGGGTVAARLAEKGHTVLLLEAGGEEAPWSYRVPVLHERRARRVPVNVLWTSESGARRGGVRSMMSST